MYCDVLSMLMRTWIGCHMSDHWLELLIKFPLRIMLLRKCFHPIREHSVISANVVVWIRSVFHFEYLVPSWWPSLGKFRKCSLHVRSMPLVAGFQSLKPHLLPTPRSLSLLYNYRSRCKHSACCLSQHAFHSLTCFPFYHGL